MKINFAIDKGRYLHVNEPRVICDHKVVKYMDVKATLVEKQKGGIVLEYES